jgi:hypothetical protein
MSNKGKTNSKTTKNKPEPKTEELSPEEMRKRLLELEKLIEKGLNRKPNRQI